MKRETILVIEDEDDILEVIDYNLRREGYNVIRSRDGVDGLKRAQAISPDLVLLDLMLPELDGIEVCQHLRADNRTSSIPIIMVTAKGEESDIVLGLGVGADDYVIKPFSPRELIARLKAVLRRVPNQENKQIGSSILRQGVSIDPEKHRVIISGDDIPFTATEFKMLHYLASNPGRVFTRDKLLSKVMGENAVVVDRTIDVHVKTIRKKLGPFRDLIETVRGVGYRFAE